MTAEKCKIVAIEHLTLDSVYEAPAFPDGDSQDGFKHKGWAMPRSNLKMQEIMGKYMASGWSLLLGMTTYEGLYESWAIKQPSSPMTHALTGVQKFVTSHRADYKLPWDNSTLLAGEATKTVAQLKKEHDKTLIIFGSGILIHSLMQRELVDEFLLMIHPIVLGSGLRLFDNKSPFTQFKLDNTITTDTGVIVAAYQRDEVEH
ncbi:MAG: dihydrofolate reductase family protein [Mucilaginibacter sp.]|uniref:dihydrofolate reductase family protein n=1 Tax=Mucilaginibacter sp. TaxID=1882438 RepID=UPI0031ACE2BA